MPHRKGFGVGVAMGFCCHSKGGVEVPMGFCCPIGRDLGSGSLWGFDVTMKGFGVGVPMGVCSPTCGVGVPKCPHLGWGPYRICCPIGRDLGLGSFGVWTSLQRGLGSGSLWGFDAL